MKKKCSICGQPAGKRIFGGRLCTECFKRLPDHFRSRAKTLSPSVAEFLLENGADKKFKSYCKTSGLGVLGLDEVHGIIGINKRKLGKKKPALFDILDIDECVLFITDPKMAKRKMTCNVEFSFRIVPCDTTVRVLAAKQIRCEYRRVSDTEVECKEPAAASFFRNIFNQTYRTALERSSARLGISGSKSETELIKAKALYMLEDGFTAKQLKSRRNQLTKVFHPDVSGEDTEDCARAIIEAYKVLLPLADKEEDA